MQGAFEYSDTVVQFMALMCIFALVFKHCLEIQTAVYLVVEWLINTGLLFGQSHHPRDITIQNPDT